MNSSLLGQNVSTAVTGQFKRDSFDSALAKNVLVVALGITINYINATMIYTFRKHQVFYTNPRYVLFIHLVINDMIQLKTSILLFVLSYISNINAFLCCIIVAFAAFTSVNTPLNLAVMAVECYIAVCFPLRHSEMCTVKRIYILIACIWALSLLSSLPDIIYFMATNSGQLFLSTLYCNISNLVTNSIIIQKKEALYILYFVSVWLVFIYTYFKIFFAAKSLKSVKCSETKKARNTIVLHSFQLLLCMLTYVYPMALKSIVQLFPLYYLHAIYVWYILVQILPRCASPILYGLRDVLFRNHLKKYLPCSVCFNHE
ncbi:odorant receptor 131-2-like [Boleophthalmus pectinirostris]|uniref:odorant receptor 131-2-like n=1 Tax=Boleophthalmus pectinirostris TaxID=150288 RepID=UPI00242CA9D9|nr:odorant receptor 131-2-like [Boleophthalmus pectinirostris]